MAITTFAAVDVGSYELDMTVYEISPKIGIRKLTRVRHILPLGSDTYTDGKISYEMIAQICKALQGFTEIMKDFGVQAWEACATSALREAKNSSIVLDQIEVQTGFKVHVLSNSEQRFLLFKAIAVKDREQFNQLIQKGTAIVDVGSGSMQLSLYDEGELITTQNMKLGTLRVLEMLAGVTPDTVDENRLIEELLGNELQTFKKLFLKDREIVNLIGVGDVIGQFAYDPATHRPFEKIEAERFQAIYRRIRSACPEDLVEKLQIPPAYAALAPASAMAYSQMLELSGARIMWVPGITLCDGIAADYAERTKLLRLGHNFDEDILSAARQISRRYMANRGHALILEKNVCRIFDSMKKYHGLGRRERLLLQLSAILHDCGKYISLGASSECSYNIIMSTEMIGLSHLEREIVANVVKYNTEEYQYSQGSLAGLSPEVQNKIMKLTAILRVGNAMDRSHKQKFKDIRISMKDRQMQIVTSTLEDISLERGLFQKKADFFEEVYGVRPVLKQRKGV